MKALGCREAKRNSALSGQGGVKSRDGGGQQGGGLAGAVAP